MKRLASFVAVAIVAGALVGGGSGAGATTNTVQILFQADQHIPAGQTCTKRALFVVPPTADGSVDGIVRMAQVQGTSSVWVVGTKIQVLTATSGNYETCLNAPAPTTYGGVGVATTFFGVPAS